KISGVQFHTLPVVDQYLSRAHTRKLAKQFTGQLIDKIRNDYGILSLSENRSHLLMWSHYASSHRGFVIGFDTRRKFFTRANGRTSKLEPVAYPASRLSLHRYEPPDFPDVSRFLLLSKSDQWRYEKEWRMVGVVANADLTTQGDGVPIHLFRFPPECVTEVI